MGEAYLGLWAEALEQYGATRTPSSVSTRVDDTGPTKSRTETSRDPVFAGLRPLCSCEKMHHAGVVAVPSVVVGCVT